MSIFDDKNLFDDDFDLFSQSADNLFGQTINFNTAKEEVKTDAKKQENENANDKLEENTDNKNKKSSKKASKKSNKSKKEELEQKEEPDENQGVDENQELESTNQEEVENNSALNAEIKEQKSKSKSKKEKAPKVKKPLSKVAIIIIVFAVFALALGGTSLTLYIIHINTKLETPIFQVYKRNNGTILNIDKVEGAYSYEISISNSANKTAVFQSQNNVVELKSYLNKAGEYSLKIRALGKTPKATSDYSEESQIVNYITLDTPIVFKDGNVIFWNPVDKAVEYKVFYKADITLDAVSFITIPQNDTLISFDLEQLNAFGPSYYPVSVQAITTSAYYLDSDYSSIVDYEYYDKLQNPIQPQLNLSSNILTFTLLNNKYKSTKYKLLITIENSGDYLTMPYVISLDEVDRINVNYENQSATKYSVNLIELTTGEILNATICALSDSKYSTDSDIINITIN